MAIGTAIKKGQSVLIFDERGKQIGLLPAHGENDAVTGYSGSSVSVRQGNVINTYAYRSGTFHHVHGSFVEAEPRSLPAVTTTPPSAWPAPSRPSAETPRSSQTQNGENYASGPNVLLVLAAVLGVAVLASPALLIVAIIRGVFSLSLGMPEAWAVALVVSGVLWMTVSTFSRDLRQAAWRYIAFCVAVTAVFLFCELRLQSDFTNRAVKLYLPGLARR